MNSFSLLDKCTQIQIILIYIVKLFLSLFLRWLFPVFWGDLESAGTLCIGDRPIGAGVAAATPDKERNLSTRNQKVMNKELFIIIKQFMMPERPSYFI